MNGTTWAIIAYVIGLVLLWGYAAALGWSLWRSAAPVTSEGEAP